MKKTLFTILIGSLLFMSGCSNNDFTLTLNQDSDNYYSYYTLSDNTDIYTNFGEIKVNFEDETDEFSKISIKTVNVFEFYSEIKQEENKVEKI